MLPGTLHANAYLTSHIRAELNWARAIVRGAKQTSAKRVQEHLTLNGFSVNIDGDFGPATEVRVKEFQASRGLATTGDVDFATWEKLVDPIVKALRPIAIGSKTLSQLTLSYARQHVAQRPREAGGDNRGPWVRCYLGWDGKDARWCAGFACYALEQAANALGVKSPINSSSSCDALALSEKAKKIFIPEVNVNAIRFQKSGILPGSFFLRKNTMTDWGHVGIVSKADAKTFSTVEGNTDSGGSSNGFEATERVRGYKKMDFIVW